MYSEKFKITAIEYLSETLDSLGRADFEEFLQGHPEYRKLFDELKETWQQIDRLKVPSPSEKMDIGFYEMLNEETKKAERSSSGPADRIRTFLESLWKPQLAYGTVILGLGLVLGYFLRPTIPSEQIKTTIVESSESETAEVRQKLVLTLLEQPSANKRLQGINEANKISETDEKVIRALLRTLNNDSNVNVRLAAIESLTNYLDNPIVREGLVQSIVRQDAPIVQVTLADLMVALQEKKSVEPFKTLIRTKELNTSVKKKLETSIESII
jgi:hypothetical protein